MADWPHPCWEAQDAARMLSIEAGTSERASDPWQGNHVFSATHVPPLIFPQSVEDFRRGMRQQEITDDELLRRISTLDPERRFVFITGTSGVGKSHLVRWLNLHLPSSDRREVITIPRGVPSLRDVILRILDHSGGSDLPEVRELLEGVSGVSHTEDGAWNRLVDELRNQIRDALPRIRSANHEDFTERRELEVAERLPQFLAEPEVQEKMRADPDNRLNRIVRSRTSKSESGDGGEGSFQLSDLPIGMSPEKEPFKKAAAELNDWMANKAGYAEAACRLIDHHIDRAQQRMLGIDEGVLVDAFLKTLDHLEERRLLLFFEDWALVSFLQHELVEAILAAEEGQVQAVVAVTTGELAKIVSTVATRSAIFTLDAPADLAENRMEELIARYMNSVRVGPDRLREAYVRGDTETDWVPNACEDCPFDAKSECHTTFGSVRVEGIGDVGLFPFTEAALATGVERHLGGTNADAVFLPRAVLTDVLKVGLGRRHRDSLIDSTFPTRELSQTLRTRQRTLPSDTVGVITERVRERHLPEEEADCWVAFLELFGDGSGDLRDHPRDVRVALDLPDLGFPSGPSDRASSKQISRKPKKATSDKPEEPVEPEVPRLVAALERWHEGGTLTDGERNELRKVVHRAVMERVDFSDGRYRASAWDGDHGFHQEQVVLDRPSPRARPVLRIEIEADIDALRGLAWSEEHGGDWSNVRFAGRAQRALYRSVDRWADTVEQHLFGEAEEARHKRIEALVRLLFVGAELLSLISDRSIAGVAEALLAESPARPPDMGGGPWRELTNLVGEGRSQTREALERDIALAQGNSSSVAVDAPVLHAIVTDATSEATFDLPQPDELPPDVEKYASGLNRELQPALNRWGDELRTWWRLNGSTIGDCKSLAVFVENENRMVNAAMEGFIRDEAIRATLDNARDRVRSDLEDWEDGELDAVHLQVGSVVDEWDDLSLLERVRIAARLGPLDPQRKRLQHYFVSVENMVKHVRSQLDSDATRSDDPGVPRQDFAKVLESLDSVLTRIEGDS